MEDTGSLYIHRNRKNTAMCDIVNADGKIMRENITIELACEIVNSFSENLEKLKNFQKSQNP